MARISTYVIDGSIVDDDKVIGSDANNSMITKNYTVRDLTAYIGYSIGNNYFVPYNNANHNVNLGSFNLTANSIIVGNQLILGGTAGLVGQVLMSNGSGSPASWGYNIGTQTLRDVLIQGNTGDKNLILSSNTTTSTIALDLEKLYGANVGLYVFDNLLNSSSALFPNKLDVQESSLQKTASYSASGIRYSNNGFNVNINPNTYANQTLLYPSNGGVLVTSVNGNLADLTGNVVVSGSIPTLQQVTDAGATSTNAISVNSLNIGTVGSKINLSGSTNNLTIYNEGTSDEILNVTNGATGSLKFGGGTYPYVEISNNPAGNVNLTAPSTGGIIPVSVNGNFANSAGNITISSSGGARIIINATSSQTAAAVAGTDYVYLVSGTTAITLPTAIGNKNRYTIKNVGTDVVSIGTTLSQTIEAGSSLITINVQNVSLDLISDDANWYII